MSLEAQIWREVSRNIELEAALPRMIDLFGELLPIEMILLRRYEREPPRFTTAALGRSAECPELARLSARSDLPGRCLSALEDFFESREASPLSALDPALARVLIPEGMAASLRGSLVVGPLRAHGEPVGAVVIALSRSARVDRKAVELLSYTLAPLGVTLENAQRVQELARMKEKLEADRDALLTRLQRQDISEVVIGASGGLRLVMERLDQVAPTDAPVLILGATGTGKEVIARAIHTRSRRREGPVVRVNCGAIPSELVDSELFGHERGAFTGAMGARKGWFERADGGTLFLDEIGELPPAAQVRLLRVLQEGTLERVGAQQTINVDVRIVAATHRDLEAMVREGSFRQDLWFRLSVFPIRLPALQERIEDLPALAAEFADRAGRRLGGMPLSLTDADIALLRQYAWPGNVRELGSVIERAAILGNGKRLEIAAALGASLDRPPSAQAGSGSYADSETAADELSVERVGAAPAGVEESEAFPTLDEITQRHIRRALERCHGRIEGPFGAAELLGVNPHTLRSRMKKLGIEWSSYREGLRRITRA